MRPPFFYHFQKRIIHMVTIFTYTYVYCFISHNPFHTLPISPIAHLNRRLATRFGSNFWEKNNFSVAKEILEMFL